MSDRNTLHIVLPDKMSSSLDEIKQETGLTKSEIARKGIQKEINELKA